MIVDDLFEIGGTGQAGKIKKVADNKITIQHDNNPGIETTVDVSKMDIDTSDPTGATVKPKKAGPQNSNNKLLSYLSPSSCSLTAAGRAQMP